MITRLEIDGFKSLSDFAVDLEPFTVFIGPNSAGKSNSPWTRWRSCRASPPGRSPMPSSKVAGQAVDQFTRWGDQAADRIRFAAEILNFELHSLGETSRAAFGMS